MSISRISLGRLSRVLANPVRWKMIAALMDGDPRRNADLMSITGTSSSNTAKHLNLLRAAGVVETRYGMNFLAKEYRHAIGQKELDLGGAVIRLDPEWLAGRH